MGQSRWSASDWDNYSSVTSQQTTSQIFTATTVDDSLDPKKNKPRESCDSKQNPNSTPIIIELDNTGSLGELAGIMARDGLGTFMGEIYTRKPVSDPHLMIMSVGDAYSDQHPLQVTQFEADISLAKQLENIYLEGNGGGNNGESYNLGWYYAAYHTEIDSFKKRGRKGIFISVGDEPMHPKLLAKHVRDIIGGELTQDIKSKDLLTKLQEKYDVYHVIVKEGDYASRYPAEVRKSWTDLLGPERVIELSDHTKLSEVLVSAIQVNEGAQADAVAKSWGGSTSVVVADALKSVAVAKGPTRGGGLINFGRKPMAPAA